MDFNYLALCHHIISKHIGIEFRELKSPFCWNLSKKELQKYMYGKLVQF